MAHIKECFFHIVGEPTAEETTRSTTNYVGATLLYDKGKGYYMMINRCGRFTIHDEKYGNHILNSFTLGDKAPYLYECVVPCARSGKAKERQAVELFDANVVDAVKRLGYEIDE